MTFSHLARAAATATTAALLLAACSSETADEAATPDLPRATAAVDFALPDAERYHRTATYPVYLNSAADQRDDETVAEISTVTPDGNTLIYTDATGKRIGFLNITEPTKPIGLGTLSLSELGHADDQPTSVAAVGEYVLVVVDTTGGNLTQPSGRIDVEAARVADLDTPDDLEPEYVSINSRGQVAVTLQENNGIAILDGRTGAVQNIFTAGTQTVDGIDTAEDGQIDQTGSITDLPREPDAIGWIGDAHVATANEGDWKGGTRGWTIFDADSGAVVWDAGNSFEQLAVRTGLHNESRSDAKGPEPEGLAITEIGGRPVALVASERSNFVAVYDVSDVTAPKFRQILPTTPAPEGILPIPARDLLVISSEADDAEARVRASVNVYGFGAAYAADGRRSAFPSLVSGDHDGAPIPWGALGALSTDPADGNRLYTATDDAYGPARILGIDLTASPALIDTTLPVTSDGEPVTLDVEGVAARPDGTFVLAVEGAAGPDNELVFVGADGAIEKRVTLPGDVAEGLGGQGLEGVAVDGDSVWVAVQREVKTDPAGVARLGRYNVADDTWEWFGYQLDSTDADGDWIGLSEIQVHDGSLLVLERDKLSGPDARVKAVYRVALPTEAGAMQVLPKALARNLLPDLQATRGYTQEKVEGLAVAGNGRLYVVTDNDGLDDANGETVFLDLGPAGTALGG
ncbi:esterase-like activity of phytase family protein [Mycolicibacterium vaccae]|uniref:esterase-like activity of phytase family protein n=1 Tax=Mycolicibacterium vaccae TaxID=1810 RepID=UPI003CE8BCF0